MGYNFTVKNGFRVKQDGEYPWPWPNDPNHTITLFTDDVLTKEEDGKYMKQTGIGCCNIVLTDEQVVPIDGEIKMRML